jgi:hypothetical protein
MELVLTLSAQGLHREMPGSGPGMTTGGRYVIPSADRLARLGVGAGSQTRRNARPCPGLPHDDRVAQLQR